MLAAIDKGSVGELVAQNGYEWRELKPSGGVAMSISEFNPVIVGSLPGPEENFCFRMMSWAEWKGVSETGVIGGVQLGQVEPGVTWWGDKVGDSTNQRGGSVHVGMDGKAKWGGETGILVALSRAEVVKKIISSRRAINSNPGQTYDAYKTKGEIAATNIKAMYYVKRDREGGDFKCYQLKSKS